MPRKFKAKPNKKIVLLCLALFFFLFKGFSFAAAPTLGTISPSSGSTAPNTAITFTTAYSDADGWANLKEAYLLVSTSSSTLANSAYLYYDQNTNLLYLRNDANSAWLGGFAPGSVNIIENSYTKLDCATTSVSGSTNTMTVRWNVTFKPAYSGKAYNTYLKIKDDTAGSAGWTKKGTYTVNNPPTLGTITPSSGTGQAEVAQAFTATYYDADSWQNIQYVYFLVNTSTSGANCLYAYYNQNTNLLYLRNDANTAWLGGYAPGSPNMIENSYAKLDCQATSVGGSATTMTVNWSVVIKTPFTGTKNTYLYVRDDVNTYQSLTQKGTWAIPNNAPSLGTVIPSSGSSQPDQVVNFITTFSDPDTWFNIQYVYFLVNTSTSGANCLYAYYNQNTNKLYLRNDASSSWLGGYAPGTANVIENSYAKLDCAATTILGSGNILTVNWQVTFKSTFTGSKKVYLYVKDDTGAYESWAQKGTWNIQQADTTPPTGTITINNDAQYSNAISVTLTLSATDSEGGMGTGAQMQLSNDNVNWSTPEAYATTKNWTLAETDGTKTVYAKFKDAAGNWSTPVSDAIILDTVPPDIVISGPADNALVNTPDITVQYTVDGAAKTKPVTLTEGANTITIQDTDAAGNIGSASISLILDTTPPGVPMLNPVASPTNVSMQALTGTKEGNSSIWLNGVEVVPINANINWSYDMNLAEGLNTINIVSKDQAGNISGAVSSNIVFDITAPTVSISINNDAVGTNSTLVMLTLSVIDSGSGMGTGAQMQFSSDGATWSAPESYATAKAWVFPSGDGAKIVYAKFKDVAGNWSTSVSDTIILDIAPPTGTIEINNANPCTNSTAISLNLSATDTGSGLSQMRFSNDNVTWSTPESYVTGKSWALTSGDGTKTVYVKFKDTAGNWSVAYSDTIILDIAPPTGTVLINNDDESTESFDVALFLSADDSGSGMGPGSLMKLSNDNANWSTPEEYSANKSWRLSDGFGAKTVYVKFQDAAGNWISQSVSDTINVINVPKERIYIYLNGQRIAMEENGKKSFFHNDHLGGTNVVTDETGRQVKYLEYRPFGETKVEEGIFNARKKFTGKELDEETGLYNFLARHYDPKIGRFISPDPLELDEEDIKPETGKTLQEFLTNPQRLNRYSYCLNNPLKYIDPAGKDVVGIHGFIGQPEGINEAFNAISDVFSGLPSHLIDWRGFDVRARNRNIHIPGPAITLRRATDRIAAYEHRQLPRVYMGHSRGADAILEAVRGGRIPLDSNTKLVLIGANREIVRGALENLERVGSVLFIAGVNDNFGGDRSYRGIASLNVLPANVRVVQTRVGHQDMGRSREVANLIRQNSDWLRK